MMMPFVRSGNGQSAGDDFQIAGGQLNDWNLSIDGLTAEIGWRNFVSYNNSLLPNLDTIQEFRNDTAAFKAEQGRMSGGSMTAVVKSGTNTLHGRAFDYYDTQYLDANSWLNNKLGRAKAIYHRNDFGAMRRAGGYSRTVQWQEQDLFPPFVRGIPLPLDGRRQPIYRSDSGDAEGRFFRLDELEWRRDSHL
jgi:hypothetical protein